MDINAVKRVVRYTEMEEEILDGYILNGKHHVPVDEDNRHYRAIEKWIAEGNIPEPADELVVPDNSKKEEALKRLKKEAKKDKTIEDILLVLGVG